MVFAKNAAAIIILLQLIAEQALNIMNVILAEM